MEVSSILNTLLSSDSVKNIAKTAGVPEDKAKDILGSALPALLHGAVGQSQDSGTAEGFAGALRQHGQANTADLGAFLKNVDLRDGAKIVNHLLGSGDVGQIAKASGSSQKDTGSVLAAAAPLLMSLLGQQTQQSQSSGGNAAIGALMGSLLQNVDMGSLLTGLLGGGTQSASGSGKKDDTKEGGGLLDALTGLLK